MDELTLGATLKEQPEDEENMKETKYKQEIRRKERKPEKMLSPSQIKTN